MQSTLLEKTEQEIATLTPPLRALWHAAHGHWDTAHKLVQDRSSLDCAWVHGYLHRVEGDLGNARYWYGYAGKPLSLDLSLDQELEEMIATLSL